MLGAFTHGAIAGEDAIDFAAQVDFAAYDAGDVSAEQERVLAPTRRDDGIPPNQLEYKIRRLVNDYLQPPKVTRKMLLAQDRFAEARADLRQMIARDAHELMRAMEVHSILDCAEMAAVASLYRTESRWGLYHYRVDFPEKNDADWFCHTQLSKSAEGTMECRKRPVDPYVVPIADSEKDAYAKQRIHAAG
jgi:succinate dehydrogenase/fumarate reductase flavoprotein subunit